MASMPLLSSMNWYSPRASRSLVVSASIYVEISQAGGAHPVDVLVRLGHHLVHDLRLRVMVALLPHVEDCLFRKTIQVYRGTRRVDEPLAAALDRRGDHVHESVRVDVVAVHGILQELHVGRDRSKMDDVILALQNPCHPVVVANIGPDKLDASIGRLASVDAGDAIAPSKRLRGHTPTDEARDARDQDVLRHGVLRAQEKKVDRMSSRESDR